MRPDLVVTVYPFRRDVTDLVERIEQVRAQHFFAVSAVEALNVGILVGLARLNEAQLDVVLFAPISERLAGQLGTIVTANRARSTMQIDHLGEKRRDAGGGNADCDIDAQRATIGFVDHVQGTEDAPAVEGVTHEVERPDGVHPRFNPQRLPLALGNTPFGPPG